MYATPAPARGEAVDYHGSITQAHGPAVVLGECPCRGCRYLPETTYVLKLPTGRVLDHVRQRSFTRTTGQKGA